MKQLQQTAELLHISLLALSLSDCTVCSATHQSVPTDRSVEEEEGDEVSRKSTMLLHTLQHILSSACEQTRHHKCGYSAARPVITFSCAHGQQSDCVALQPLNKDDLWMEMVSEHRRSGSMTLCQL